jgi:phosphatidate cytidylyltransferase
VSNLAQRILTAIVGISLVLAAVLYGEFSFLLLLLIIVVLGTMEFYRHLEHDGVHPQQLPGVLLAASPFIAPVLSSGLGIALNLLPIILALPYLIFIRELWTKAEKPFTNIGMTLLGAIYISFPLFLFYLFAFQGNEPGSYHAFNILGYFFILWAGDTGAYFTGRFLGRHKLFERISPKKTWEGFFGGLFLAMTVAFVVSRYFTGFDLVDWLAIGLIIAVTGAFGDLVESLFKRSIQVKDSGSLLPGHGGILDRFDGLFISAPFVFVYVLLFD